ncbi:hypothetical protein EYF80_040354 [Liparis tanakae]|uniref:Uncharacterized protein n=1 Tax=Liparis tanakae TaxID=230148 RepID=A0A4Z2G7D8_9TELE|nr:hypothetical protein EYF80_040354 [Liparis tanakae]
MMLPSQKPLNPVAFTLWCDEQTEDLYHPAGSEETIKIPAEQQTSTCYPKQLDLVNKKEASPLGDDTRGSALAWSIPPDPLGTLLGPEHAVRVD